MFRNQSLSNLVRNKGTFRIGLSNVMRVFILLVYLLSLAGGSAVSVGAADEAALDTDSQPVAEAALDTGSQPVAEAALDAESQPVAGASSGAGIESVITAADLEYVGDIGSATSKTPGETLVIVTTAAVAAGDDIIVALATNTVPTYTVSVSDSAGNTYEEAAQAVCYQRGRTFIFAAYNVNALPSGGSITITHTEVAARVALASVFRGLADVDPLDQYLGEPALGAMDAPSGTTASVGRTEMTTQANELLVSAIGTQGPVGDSPGNWQFEFLDGPRAGTTGDADDSNWTVSLGYRIVPGTERYEAQKNNLTERYWAATIATFKGESITNTHSLTVTIDPEATATIRPSLGVHSYVEGTVVEFWTVPYEGYQFVEWSGACTGSGDCVVTMDADKAVTANFTQTQTTYNLTVQVDPAGAGTTDPAVGTYAYDTGEVVTVTAEANTGYQFDEWSGACSGTGDCVVTMNANMTVTANFTQTQTTYNLTVLVDPAGAGTTSPSGTTSYVEGTEVTVTATENPGYQFDSWSGACSGDGACVVTMDADKTVTANFDRLYDLTVLVDPAGAGTTSPSGTTSYVEGTEVTVTATENPGYQFDEWSGACSGDGACVVTMDADKTVTANFVQLPPDLSIIKEDGGEGVRAGDTISYVLTYYNDGGDATGVIITETVPANTSFDSVASTAGWVCEPDGSAGSVCTFDVGEVANGDGGMVIFAVTVDDPLPIEVTEIDNTAVIGDDGSGGMDSNPEDNTDSVQTAIVRYMNYLPLIFNNS
jgi:uncharacterized repeat protein (TIGR01451 family)